MEHSAMLCTLTSYTPTLNGLQGFLEFDFYLYKTSHEKSTVNMSLSMIALPFIPFTPDFRVTSGTFSSEGSTTSYSDISRLLEYGLY